MFVSFTTEQEKFFLARQTLPVLWTVLLTTLQPGSSQVASFSSRYNPTEIEPPTQYFGTLSLEYLGSYHMSLTPTTTLCPLVMSHRCSRHRNKWNTCLMCWWTTKKIKSRHTMSKLELQNINNLSLSSHSCGEKNSRFQTWTDKRSIQASSRRLIHCFL